MKYIISRNFIFSLRLPVSFSLLLCFSLLAGCSFTSKDSQQDQIAWLQSGTLSIGGPLENLGNQNVSEISDNEYLKQSYGFSISGPRSLVIEPSKNRATLFSAGKQIATANILEDPSTLLSLIPAGNYTIEHKQRNALWYAPDQYFSSRGLSIPDQGDKMRFLRGAYGDFAIFLDAEKAIHTGPFALSELSGVRCDEKEMSKIFYTVEIGDQVQVLSSASGS